MTKPLSVGVIGAGRIGRLHAENLKFSPLYQLKYVSDPYLDQSWSDTLGVSGLKEHQPILADPEVEAIFICSPTPTHAPLIIEAAQHNKAIFCEKPISLDLETTESCLQQVDSLGAKLQIGFNRRFDPNFDQIKQVIEGNKIGRPHLLRITSRDPSPPSLEYVKSSGGMFLDMSVHDFDMARFLMASEVVEVFTVGANLVDPAIGEAGDVDTAIITLKFDNGAIGVIDNSRKAVYGYDQRVEVFGSLGAIATENEVPTRTVLSTQDGIVSEKPLNFFLERYQQAYLREIDSFYHYCRSSEASPVSGNDGLMALKIGVAAQKSLDTNVPVSVK